MNWSDRRYDDDASGNLGRPGGDWEGVRPSLDNPMTWSLPLMRVRRISVRVHLIFLIFIVVRLARSLAGPSTDTMRWDSLGLVALDLASLFGIVLLHEFGHCVACRFVHGEANEILMWPLGGLAFCRPPHHWMAHLVTALGGPMVNVLIFVILAPVLGALTGVWWGAAIPNPLDIPAFGVLEVEGAPVFAMYALYSVHSMSLLILLFNLLPIYPLDGGRIVQAALWPKFGYGRSMRLAVYTGYVGALGLFIFGAVISDWVVIGIAFFGGLTCYFTVRQLQFTESVMGTSEDLYAASRWTEQEIAAPAETEAEPERETATATSRRARRQARSEQEESEELDRILAKIAEEGIDSLSTAEHRLLKRETERRKGGGNAEV